MPKQEAGGKKVKLHHFFIIWPKQSSTKQKIILAKKKSYVITRYTKLWVKITPKSTVIWFLLKNVLSSIMKDNIIILTCSCILNLIIMPNPKLM